jgi:hypothetical protein
MLHESLQFLTGAVVWNRPGLGLVAKPAEDAGVALRSRFVAVSYDAAAERSSGYEQEVERLLGRARKQVRCSLGITETDPAVSRLSGFRYSDT